MRGSAALNGMIQNQPRNGPQAACLVEAEPRATRLGFPALGCPISKCNLGRLSSVDPRPQSFRLAEFGGRGMSFDICRGTLGSLAMFTGIRNASSRVSRLAADRRQFSATRNVALGPFRPSWRVASLVVIGVRSDMVGCGRKRRE